MSIEASLHGVFDEEARIYGLALSLARELASNEDDAPSETLVAEITRHLDDIRKIEEASDSLRTQIRHGDGAAPEPLARRVEHVKVLITQLQEQIALVMTKAQRRKTILTQRIDDSVRQEQGRRAYGASRPDYSS